MLLGLPDQCGMDGRSMQHAWRHEKHIHRKYQSEYVKGGLIAANYAAVRILLKYSCCGIGRCGQDSSGSRGRTRGGLKLDSKESVSVKD